MSAEDTRVFSYALHGAEAAANTAYRRATVAALLCFAAALPLLYSAPPPSLDARSMLDGTFVYLLFIISVYGIVVLHLSTRPLVFALSDIPLMVGVVLLTPWSLVIVRCTSVLHGLLTGRHSTDRAIFNVGYFTLEAAVAAGVYHALPHDGLHDPRAWLAGVVSIVVAGLITTPIVMFYYALEAGQPLTELGWQPLRIATVVGVSLAPLGLFATWSYQQSVWAGPFIVFGFWAVVVLNKHRHANNKRVKALNAFRMRTEHEGCEESDIMNAVAYIACELTNSDRADISVARGTAHEESLTIMRNTGTSLWAGLRAAFHHGGSIVGVFPGPGGTAATLRITKTRAELGTFTTAHLAILGPLLGLARSRWNSVALVRQARHDADHDTLTGLPNQGRFLADLTHREGPGLLACLRGADTHNLTTAFGMEAADNVAVVIGLALQEIRGDYPDIGCARLTHTTFALWLPDARAELLTDVVDRIARPVRLGNLPISLRLHVGFSHVGMDTTPQVALHQATTALIGAASQGSVTPEEFSQDNIVETRSRVQLSEDLQPALAAGSVTAAFQPQIDAGTGNVVRCEALMRWNHPEQGFISPDVIVQVAESSRQMSHITGHMLGLALRECRAWQETAPDVGVAVNVAPTDLSDPAFVERVAQALEHENLAPHLLAIEVTESAMMTSPQQAIRTLGLLQEVGVYTSVDDFGTGYSSLSYLVELPVDEVKIDKSFILRLGSGHTERRMVQHVIAMLHDLGRSVVAEGVEDEYVVDFLRAAQCDVLQGYHFSRPLPFPDLLSWMQERNEKASVRQPS